MPEQAVAIYRCKRCGELIKGEAKVLDTNINDPVEAILAGDGYAIEHYHICSYGMGVGVMELIGWDIEGVL